MKLITVLTFTLVLLGLSFSQSVDPNTSVNGSEVSTEGSDFSALTPLVKGLTDGFRMLMLQVSFVRMLFENMGVELGRIARNATASSFGSGLPYPFPSQYSGLNREESSSTSEPSQPSEIQAIFSTQIQAVLDNWGQNTAVALRSLLTEVAHVYQDIIATMVKQGEVSRNQVLRGYNTLQTAMTSISKMIQDNFPSATSVANSISNISSAVSQNVTNILSGMVPDGLPTGLPSLPSFPNLPNLQDLIPTTSMSPSTKRNN